MGRLSLFVRYIAVLTALSVAAGGFVAPSSAVAATSPQASTTAQKSEKKSSASKSKKKSTAKTSRKSKARKKSYAPAKPSYGQRMGLHATPDPLALKSGVALVVDQDTDEVLFSKNPQAVLPIASITKLMTALVVVESGQSFDDVLTISRDDIDTEKGSHSRLAVGTRLPRLELMHLALMSSENRAAHALGRNYPGGLQAFVAEMNRKARELGMTDTRYVDPTGLSSRNQSSARDLALLVKTAYGHDLIRTMSTSREHYVYVGQRQLMFRNSNSLVRNPEWSIGLQKTGYISEAGRCVVMQTELAGRKLIMVLLDSAGHYSRTADAERLRHWLSSSVAQQPS